jgi:heptosyltransferase II
MNILIELPSWLGDTVMATPAIESINKYFDDPKITILGSDISVEVMKYHPNVVNSIIFKKDLNFIFSQKNFIYKFDSVFSFRSSLRSKIFIARLKCQKKYSFNKKKFINLHQVEKYNKFINESLGINYEAGDLKIYTRDSKSFKNLLPIVGINPGATYGSSKRWYPEEFAKVAIRLSNAYDILIFGGPDEKIIADDIERLLIKSGVQNYQNLTGLTSIEELINYISSLSLFITGDSGPMHLAACFKVPTVSIFGPTNDFETSQWRNSRGVIIKKNLDCQPCMKRKCPLGHHHCMKDLKAEEVIDVVSSII